MLKFQKKKLISKIDEISAQNLERLDFASQFDRPESISGTLQMLKLKYERRILHATCHTACCTLPAAHCHLPAARCPLQAAWFACRAHSLS